MQRGLVYQHPPHDFGVSIPCTYIPSKITPDNPKAALYTRFNNQLTDTRYLPGLIHALYLEHVYYSRRNVAPSAAPWKDAPGVYSDHIQHGGRHHQKQGGYGTV